MEFPPMSRMASYISQRPPSSLEPTPPSSPHSSFSHHDDADQDDPDTALTPHISRDSTPPMSRKVTRMTTRGSTLTQDPSYEVEFEAGAPDDPRNWPMWYKSFVLFSVSFGTLVVVLYSTSYTSALGAMRQEFHIKNEAITTLGVTSYLFGLSIGSLVLAPISETYGRRPVYVLSMLVFFILIAPCAKATSIAEIIVFRFLGALAGSAMIANAPGTIGDIIGDEFRATAFSIWSIGPMNGPTIGPIVGGFVTQYKGWRWANWVVMIAGAAAFVFMLIIKETYTPALLQSKAKKLRKDTGDERYWSQFDTKLPFLELMKVNLSRPFIMAVTEPICIFWNCYISVIYGILYLCFVAYPIVFTEARGWSVSMSGLAFVGIGIGCMVTIVSAPLIRRVINAHKPDASGHIPPEAAMSVVCIAAIMVPIGELWFAWTCLPKTIHWAAPIAAGIPFGFGNGVVFIYASNYLVHSYGIYAASALAGNAFIRMVLGGTLPLAGPPMYKALGANWAGTTLGLLEVLIIPIPFIFYKYGHRIREKSTLIRQMREIELKQERKKQRAIEKLQKANAAGDPEKAAAARLVLKRVMTDMTGAGNEKDAMAQAELTRVEGLRSDDVV